MQDKDQCDYKHCTMQAFDTAFGVAQGADCWMEGHGL